MTRPLRGLCQASSVGRDSNASPAKCLPFQEHRTKVSPFVREAFLREMPGLGAVSAESCFDRRLLAHWLSPARRDAGTGGAIIPFQLIAQFADTACDSNFVARDWLDGFQRRYGSRLGITVSDHVFSQGKARTLALDLPAPLQRALAEQDFLSLEGDDMAKARRREQVDFVSGQRISRDREKQDKQALISFREEANAETPPESMQRFLQILLNDHLTNRSQTIYAALMEGLPRFAAWLEAYLASPLRDRHCGKVVDRAAQEHRRRWLVRLLGPLTERFPEGYYASGPRSVRLHARGFIPHYFPREGRVALLGHLTRLDLRSSQLAITARLWGAEKTLQVLGRGSIWDYFLRELDLEINAKPALKMCVYALCFGMQESHLSPRLTEELREAGHSRKRATCIAKTFLASDIMREMLDARKQALQDIRDNAGVRLPGWECEGRKHEGRFIHLDDILPDWLQPEDEAEEWDDTGGFYQALGANERSVRSLLAQQMQAAEMGIMLAAAEVIAKTPGCTIVSFLHDGLTLHFRDGGKREQQTRAIQKAVRLHCAAKGYPTGLELEKG